MRRAFTLSGVLPLGAFLVVHAAANARAVAGDRAFGAVAGFFARVPGLALVEVLLVFGPLALHAALGTWLVATRRPLAGREATPRGLRLAMHATGVVAIAFLAMHLPELRLRAGTARLDAGSLQTVLAADLSTMRGGLPLRALAYLAGAACVCFHFVAGLWGLFTSSPRGEVPRARRRAAWWAGAVGLAIWLLFADAVVYYATGARLFGGAAPAPASTEPCPSP